MTPQPFSDVSCDPPVRGVLHRPVAPFSDGIVLAHGAGSNHNSPILIAVADALARSGIAALRCDLPFRQTRPHGPPGPGDAARDRVGLKNAVAAMKNIATGRIFLGGHSYGGRQATMLCAELAKEDAQLASGLLLFSYPLHPPRKPEQLRTQHFPRLQTKALFVHGTRDPFGSIGEMEAALQLIPAPTRLLAIEGAGHELLPKAKAAAEAMMRKVEAAVQTFLLSC